MLFTWIWVLKSRQSGGRLSYKGTFSIALDTQVKRKCRTSQLLSYFSIALGTQVKRKWRISNLLLYFFCYFVYPNQERVEGVPCIIILFSITLCTEMKIMWATFSHDHTVSDVFYYLWAFKLRESGECLSN